MLYNGSAAILIVKRDLVVTSTVDAALLMDAEDDVRAAKMGAFTAGRDAMPFVKKMPVVSHGAGAAGVQTTPTSQPTSHLVAAHGLADERAGVEAELGVFAVMWVNSL